MRGFDRLTTPDDRLGHRTAHRMGLPRRRNSLA